MVAKQGPNVLLCSRKGQLLHAVLVYCETAVLLCPRNISCSPSNSIPQVDVQEYSYMLPYPIIESRFLTMFPGRKYLFDLGMGKFNSWAGGSSYTDRQADGWHALLPDNKTDRQAGRQRRGLADG
jgi:hypothetical protein